MVEDVKKACNFLLSEKLHKKLDYYCKKNDKKKGRVIEKAIEEYLEKEGGK